MVKRFYLGLGVTAALLCGGIGCNAVLGLGDFSFDATDAGTDASADALSQDGGDGCAVDLTQVCYACTPQTTEQFLNSCADGTQCLQFDRSRLTGLLLPDGALPPLPPIADAGGQ